MPQRFRGLGAGYAASTPAAFAAPAGSLSARTVVAAQAALAGRGHGWARQLAFTGPAVVASIAYMDPGNFATNVEAGARYGYGLLWVVVLANLVAMLFQALSAKLGIVTGRNLAELSREHFPPPVVWTMWLVSEIAAMVTDLAEFLGGAIGLSLLLQLPLLAGMAVTGVIVCAILALQRLGFRPLESDPAAVARLFAEADRLFPTSRGGGAFQLHRNCQPAMAASGHGPSSLSTPRVPALGSIAVAPWRS